MQEQFLKFKDSLPAVSERELSLYCRHFELLKEWNEKIALVSRKSIDKSFENHYADSLFISDFAHRYFRPGEPVSDLGTGAGFPGVIFAIRYPDAKVTLYEKLQKKRLFLEAVLADLKLPNLKLDSAMPERQFAGMVLARAVMPPPELFPFLQPRLAKGTRLILNLGSQSPDPELPAWLKKITEHRYTLPLDAGPRRLLCLEKS